jgi:hypothetical protein
MNTFEWAVFDARALGQLVRLLLRHIVTSDLALVARIAKVCVAPAEPRRDVAAKLALPLHELVVINQKQKQKTKANKMSQQNRGTTSSAICKKNPNVCMIKTHTVYRLN